MLMIIEEAVGTFNYISIRDLHMVKQNCSGSYPFRLWNLASTAVVSKHLSSRG
jgi:hypothetical protein